MHVVFHRFDLSMLVNGIIVLHLEIKTSHHCILGSNVCRRGGLTKLSQTPELTFYRAGGGDILRDLFLWPFSGSRYHVPFTGVVNEEPSKTQLS